MAPNKSLSDRLFFFSMLINRFFKHSTWGGICLKHLVDGVFLFGNGSGRVRFCQMNWSAEKMSIAVDADLNCNSSRWCIGAAENKKAFHWSKICPIVLFFSDQILLNIMRSVKFVLFWSKKYTQNRYKIWESLLLVKSNIPVESNQLFSFHCREQKNISIATDEQNSLWNTSIDCVSKTNPNEFKIEFLAGNCCFKAWLQLLELLMHMYETRGSTKRMGDWLVERQSIFFQIIGLASVEQKSIRLSSQAEAAELSFLNARRELLLTRPQA